jgi:hypothetical protein
MSNMRCKNSLLYDDILSDKRAGFEARPAPAQRSARMPEAFFLRIKLSFYMRPYRYNPAQVVVRLGLLAGLSYRGVASGR